MTSKSNLVINPQRLWDSIMDTAKFGGTAKGGIKRLTVSDEDKRVRDWFKALYEVLFGQEQGPRFGSFAAIFGVRETSALIRKGLAGDLSKAA